MSLRETLLAVQGYQRHFEIEQQFAWERCRWQTCLLLNVHTAKGKSLRPTDLMEFPWEMSDHPPKRRALTDLDKTILNKWDGGNS